MMEDKDKFEKKALSEPEKRGTDRLMVYQERARNLVEKVIKGELSPEQASEIIARSMARFEEQIGTDRLTGILNRQGIRTQIGWEIAHARRGGTSLSLLMLDLDGFGKINKEQGFDEGNRAIKTMAGFLRQKVVGRQTDSIGRLGGDEFIVICPFTDQQGALKLAEEIKSSLSDYMSQAGFSFTTSVGVSTMRKDNQNVGTLLHEADEAQMSAKKNGKNRVEEYLATS